MAKKTKPEIKLEPHVPAYKLPDFCQSLPGHPDRFELVAGNRNTHVLQYRNRKTGKTYSVPNIPCNQQSVVRLEVSRRNLQWAEESLPAITNPSIKQVRRQTIQNLRDIVQYLDARVSRLPVAA